MFPLALLSALLVAQTAARVETCPDGAALDKNQRRAQAERWFSRGEQAVKENRSLDAQRAFQCSLRLVPHGFTAYNLGRLAERVGDLELAISAYDQYLLLTPGANDTEAIEAKLAELRERMAKAQPQPVGPVAESPRSPLAPPPAAAPVGSPVPPLAPPLADKPALPNWVRTAGWVSLAAGGALVVTGVVFNLGARDAMDNCRSLYRAADEGGARSSCSSARQQAYASYALFGVGAAAGTTALILLLIPHSPATVTAGNDGVSLLWNGHF